MHEDESDPTGMRELLRSLPEPGPMPEHLVARIQASLSDLDPLEAETDVGSQGDVPRETSATGRSPWLARHGGKLAVAAVIVVGGGAVASGQLGGFGAAGGMSSGSSAGDSAAEQRDTDGDAVQGGAEATSAPATVEGPVVVQLSGRRYTAAGLATQLTVMAPAPQAGPLASESPAIGPIGSEIGVRSCLEALGLPRGTATRVDLAFVDDVPAAVLVVTVDGARTAYAVGRDCTTGNPSLLVGPVPVP